MITSSRLVVLFSMNEIMNKSIRSFGVSKWPKNRFLQYFCCQQDQNSDMKMRFFDLFRAEMNTIGIQNPKLIVTNDNQQSLPHFEWFLAHFQISDVKPKLS